jgi:type IV secretion system protein VirB1
MIRKTIALLSLLAIQAVPCLASRQSIMLPIPGLIARCAPQVHPQTLTAIIDVESGGWPWTIHDNTNGSSMFLTSYQSAVATASGLLAQGDNLDVGVAQLNSGNFPGLGLNVVSAFDECTNIAGGATILTNCYKRAVQHFGDALAQRYPYFTVRFAVSCYNTNSLFAGAGYVEKVLAAAGQLGSLPSYAVRRSAIGPAPHAPAHRMAVPIVTWGIHK